MTVTYGFYNSLAGDRKYNADQMSSLFEGIITDGVFMNVGAALVVVPNSGMTVDVSPGRAWFNRTWTNNDAMYSVEVAMADPVNPRIDVLVLEINTHDQSRTNSFKMVEGTPAATPQIPSLIANIPSLYEHYAYRYPIAYITVGAGVGEIDASDITNMVGSGSCPFITGPLEHVNIDAWLTQWQNQYSDWLDTMQSEQIDEFVKWQTEFQVWLDAAQEKLDLDYGGWSSQMTSWYTEFDAWFNNIKDQLSTDAAGNLQNQIDVLNAGVTKLRLIGRVGNSDSNWGSAGSSIHLGEQAGIQAGSVLCTGYAGDVVFPVAFASVPLVMLTVVDSASRASAQVNTTFSPVTVNGFSIILTVHVPGQTTLEHPTDVSSLLTQVNWLAIGPMGSYVVPPPVDPGDPGAP